MSRRTWIGLGLVVAMFVVLYARGLGNAYVWDDVVEIQTAAVYDRPLAEGIVQTQTERTDPALLQLQDVTIAYDSYRPLLFATYWLEVQLFGRDPLPMHATNLVLGVLAILVAFALARRLLPEADRGYALAAAAVFALHPIQVEPIAYISGRGDLLSGLLALCAGYAAVRGGRWVAVAAVAFAASLLAKESGIGLPVAVAAIFALRGELRARWWIPAVLVAVAIAYLGLRAALITSTSSATLADAIVALPGVWLEYARIAVLPFDLSTERLHADTFTVAGWLVVGFAAVLALALRKRELPAVRAAAAGLAWFALLLGPAAVAVTANRVTADRYAYAAMFGLALALAALAAHVVRAWRRGRLVVAIAAGVWGALVLAVAWLQVPVWQDNLTLYTHAVELAPDSSEAHYRLGFLAARDGDWETAIPLLEAALDRDPKNVRALNNLGVGLMQLRDFTEAEGVLQRAVEANPIHYRSWFNLGVTRLALGKRDPGCAALRRAVQLAPSYERARAEIQRSCR